MLFANGKPLGPNGLDWIKIHLINLTGTMKKSSLAERLNYANEILDEIIDSANFPLTGKKWWQNCEFDDPWQILAACKEIRNALDPVRCPDGPSSYVSHFPVHQDGSCNGLQHYAALGRDQAGAESVNLEPGDQPRDVYQVVASMVEAQRSREAKQGNKLASSLEGVIKRKVVKQTVMTFVYGVTKFGARKQVMKQLKEMEEFDEKKTWLASGYIMNKIFDAIREMFTATRDIQLWLTSAAILISREMNSPVKWSTPLGLPVVQPYFKQVSNWRSGPSPGPSALASKLSMKGSKLRYGPSSHILKPNVMKQKNSFPPNFIHSLDSTHMMATTLHCEALGVEFVSVHDCYWTHPCTVDTMNRICREQFVALHNLPILQHLSESFIRNYQTDLALIQSKDPELVQQIINIFTAVPASGKFDIEKVIHSTYFFS